MILQPLSRADRRRLSSEHGIERRYRIRERLDDGAVYRTFWFTDRDDADAFLWAAITGSLRYEHELWKLPVPCWEPAWPDVSYDFATLVLLTSTSASNQSWTVPSDFNATSNSIQAIGAGGSGAQSSSASGNTAAGGGGGGGWAQIVNAALLQGAAAAFFLNVGAAGPLGTASQNGLTGSGTWMRIDGGSTSPATTAQGLVGTGGGGGLGGTGTVSGGAGGSGNIGTSSATGGSGAAAIGTGGLASGGGGGGAAGPNGIGATSGTPTNSFSAGGTGDNAAGGAGGGTPGAVGSNGVEIGGGAGSGGGGAGLTGGGTAGAGGNAGAGGGGSAHNSATNTRGGDGGRGSIWITYQPAIPGFNQPMLGL